MSNAKRTTFRYDKENDILYISFGPPRPSFCVAEIDDIYIMQDIETGGYSGITMFDFKQRFKDGSVFDLKLPIAVDFKEIGKEVITQ